MKNRLLAGAGLALLIASLLGFALVLPDHVPSQFKHLRKPLSIPDMLIKLTSAAPSGAEGTTEVIELTERNSITFRGVVTSKKVAELELALMAKSRVMNANETIYLVMDTPGGSIDAGNEFISLTQSLPQNVKTLTVFAASMGFQIVQNLDERLILPHGILMSHRAKFKGLGGEVPGELITQLNFWLKDIARLDAIAAERMGMPVADYQNMIRDEYWVNGEDAVHDKAADRVVLARCDESLDGTTKELLLVFMGIKVYGVMSRCPVVTGILGLELDGGENAAQRAQALQEGLRYRDNRSMFVEYSR